KPTDDIFTKDTSQNIGYFILQLIYQALNLKSFFQEKAAERKFIYNCNDINRFLTYDRILNQDQSCLFATALTFTMNNLRSHINKH
ncbi:MAG: hypothetical protein RR986_03890, partial [Longicatena sp.]